MDGPGVELAQLKSQATQALRPGLWRQLYSKTELQGTVNAWYYYDLVITRRISEAVGVPVRSQAQLRLLLFHRQDKVAQIFQ